MAPASELVAAGIIPHVDYADAANPGPQWAAELAEVASAERTERALAALGELSKADVTAILEALGGK